MTVPLRVLGLVYTVLLTLTACSKSEQPQMPTPEVSIVEAKPQTTPIQLDLVGRLSAYRSADVRARVAGILQKRIYTEGTEVKRRSAAVPNRPCAISSHAVRSTRPFSCSRSHV